ncbi:MAG: beta-L-arabinofuranosidase domain-containing protein [Candidatus Aminicenantales bacterium]
MSSSIPRREFLKVASATPFVLADMAKGQVPGAAAPALKPLDISSLVKLEPFNYRGVRLGESRWQKQYQSARDFYYGVSDDDILCGFRSDCGLPAPGHPLGGWAEHDSSVIFGQWLSGMARMYRATGDAAIRDKAVKLLTEWARTIPADGNCRMGLYPFEKLLCGLADMYEYADRPEAYDILDKILPYASRTFDRTRTPAGPTPWELHSGVPLEWYTMSENLLRAYAHTGNPRYKEFADVWLYHSYWKKFAETNDPSDAMGVHAYSHVNSFSSAAMAYAVTGDAAYLKAVRNAYDFMQNRQTFATGGYGPAERILPSDGSLGRSLEMRLDSCETPCCSWAAFKMSRYLMMFTGEARYGDWIERLLYNGIGAVLPITTGGRHFYYADYRSAAVKYYSRNPYTCCSGTYIQAVAAYHDLIYFRDAGGLNVNLYLPSEAVWDRPGGEVRIKQETGFPEAETSALTLEMKRSEAFALRLRVPGWAGNAAISINGAPSGAACVPGTWAVLDRTWNSGDKVEIRLPLRFRLQPVDAWHPTRVALVRGPVVFVQEGNTHEPIYRFPENEDALNAQLVPENGPVNFRFVPPDKTRVQALVRPFYDLTENYPYRMYVDLKDVPFELWKA